MQQYIAHFLRHSKQFLEDGSEVNVLIPDNNPHQGEKGELREILSWKQEGEEIELIPLTE